MNDFEGAEVLVTRFQGDTGEADPDLRALLAEPGTFEAQRRIVERLRTGRLLIPVVAALDEADAEGGDKHSHMAAVIIADQAGRRALMCFTGVDSVTTWRADARPQPVTGVEAAQAALQEDCAALLVDAAGPHRYALSGTGLWALAAGGPWRHPLEEPAVVEAMDDVLAASGLRGRFVADPTTVDGVAVELLDPDRDRVAALASELAQLPEVRARVSSLEVRLVR